MSIQNFVPVFGLPLEVDGETLIFKGGTLNNASPDGQPNIKNGVYVTPQYFSSGRISVTIRFSEPTEVSCADVLLSYDPNTSNMLDAGIPGHPYALFAIREFTAGKWTEIKNMGTKAALIPNKDYKIEVSVQGSVVALFCDGAEVLRALITKNYPSGQVGLFLLDRHDIHVKDFKITTQNPKAFVISQFSAPYNDVYLEVIKDVCKELKVDVIRADETPGPGLIIADVTRGINDATFVIADISPVNANVFYELGYAHGIDKPAILIAERNTKLPFDVSPFRTLFYENTIGGKSKLENGLRQYIEAVIGKVN